MYKRQARYVGIKVERVIMRTLLLSGAICGVAGLLLVAGTDHTITKDGITASSVDLSKYEGSVKAVADRAAAIKAEMCIRDRLKARGLRIIESETPIIPIYTYEMENTLTSAKRLYDAGVYVNPVLPPRCV